MGGATGEKTIATNTEDALIGASCVVECSYLIEQLDKLVQLIESPVLAPLRMQVRSPVYMYHIYICIYIYIYITYMYICNYMDMYIYL